jgi:hypothetical protein
LTIGTDTQAFDAGLLDIAGLAVTDSNIIVGNGANWVAESGATARTSLGLAIGTDVQAFDSELSDIASTTATKGDLITSDGTDWLDFPVGADGTFLVASSTASNGITWVARTWGDYLTETAYDVDLDQEVAERTILSNWSDAGFVASSTNIFPIRRAITVEEYGCVGGNNASASTTVEWRSINTPNTASSTNIISSENSSTGGTVASTTSFAITTVDADSVLAFIITDASSTGAYPDFHTCWLNFQVVD